MLAAGQLGPGNWIVGMVSGAHMGGALLGVMLIAGGLAWFVQHLALALGSVTDAHLVHVCSHHYSRPVVALVWLMSELALLLHDATVILGSALAVSALFGMPLHTSIITMAGIAVVIWVVQSYRQLDGVALLLVVGGGVGVGYLLMLTAPIRIDIGGAVVLRDPQAWRMVLAVAGAMVMPHTVYLHPLRHAPSVRVHRNVVAGVLGGTLCLNAAMLVLGATAFHGTAYQYIAGFEAAYALLLPVTGSIAAGFVLGFCVLGAGLATLFASGRARQREATGVARNRMHQQLIRITGVGAVVILTLLGAGTDVALTVNARIVQYQALVLVPMLGIMAALLWVTSDARVMGTSVTPPWVQYMGWVTVALISVAVCASMPWVVW